MSGEVEILPKDLDKAVAERVRNEVTLIMKKDYRATVVHRDESKGIDPTEAELIHIDETKKDELGNPLQLDTKGNASPYEVFFSVQVKLSQALTKLKKWRYFEEIVTDRDGEEHIIRTDVDLPTMFMRFRARGNQGKSGWQSYMHIKERRANAGRDPDQESNLNWLGLGSERRDKKEKIREYQRD